MMRLMGGISHRTRLAFKVEVWKGVLEHMAIGLRVRVHLAGLRVNALIRIICARVPPG